MVEEIRMQTLIDKIIVVQDATERTYNKYSAILDLMDEHASTVNGYPARSVELLEEVLVRLNNLEHAIVNVQPTIPEKTKGSVVFWYMIISFILMMLGSFLGVLFHGLLFHIK